jgi:putative ABC transport system permease protein
MRHQIVVVLRNLSRERLYAAINIAGLSLGIACCMILGLFLRSELTYDRYNVQHDHIFRVVNEFTTAGTSDRFAVTSRSLGPMLAEEYPQIKSFVRFEPAGNQGGIAIHHGSDTYFWEDAYYVDPSVFDVFTFDVIYGDPKSALKDGSSVAVSQSFAHKYFGSANPIGETISTDDGIPLKINLVYADQPNNTHLKYDLLFSRNNARLLDPDNQTQRRQQLWNIGDYTYLLVAPGFNPRDWPRINDEFYNRNMADFGKSLNSHWRSSLQKLTDTHLQSDVGYDRPNGNRIYLYGCAAVALFILAVACINYMNLATARATRRARSVGIRKILGASRLSLALQFLGEAVLFAVIASILGIVIVEVTLRLTSINSLMEQQVTFNLFHEPQLVGWLVGIAILVGILAGAYPAVYLSSWAPLSALTGRYTAGKGHARMRELLVLLQFTISAAVIASTLLMQSQMRYIANRPLGFQKENRLVVTLRGASTIEKIPTIRTELGKNAHILGVTEAVTLPGQSTGVNLVQADNNNGVPTSVSIFNMPVATDFVAVMGLQIVRGRDFSQRLLTDTGLSALVNETMVHKMGWIEPLGKRIQAGGPSGPVIHVIGVVKDFNFKSLHTLIEPFGMLPLNDDLSGLPESARPSQQRLLVLNIKGDDVGKTLDYVGDVMRQVDARHPFNYAFLDQQLDNLYKSEHNLTRLIGIFAAICIFIACLGLFGLVAFTTEQRSREIGTRKVLGASAFQIIMLLAQRILLLVVIASVLAAVLSYFAMDKWLAGFAYRAAINPLVFVLAAVLAAGVAFITVALQSYKTASADPVNALREE